MKVRRILVSAVASALCLVVPAGTGVAAQDDSKGPE